MRFEVAGPADEAAVRRLLRESPMEGTIRLTLEREPDAFLSTTIEGDLHQTITAWGQGRTRLLGMGSRAVMTAFVDGAPTRVGYLSQLRVDRTQPAGARLLRGGYALLRELHADGEAPFYLTTIVEDNRPARRLLEAGLSWLPRYRPLEPIVTLVLRVPPRARRRGTTDVVTGSAERLDAIVDCLRRNGRRHQFARAWEEIDLRCAERTRGLEPEDFLLRVDGERVVGCLAVWDQRGFKQTVVRGYAPWLGRARPVVNVLAPLLRQARLPPPGTPLRMAFASHVAIDADEPVTVTELLDAAMARAASRGIDYLVLGLARRHPLLTAVKRRYAHREYVSLLYLVRWEDDGLGQPSLDDRVPHVEVATL